MKRLLLLLFWVSFVSLALANTPYTIVLSNDKSDVNSSIDKKEYFSYLTLQNTSDTLLNLVDIELTPFVETSSGKPAEGTISINGESGFKSYSVNPGKTVRLEVRCSFPEEGIYQAVFSMSVVANKKKNLVTKKFLVTYAKPVRSKKGKKKPFYMVKSIHTAEGTLGNLSVQMVLEDSSGQGGKITQIEPVIWRMGDGTELKSTNFGSIPISQDSTLLAGPLDFDEAKFQTLNLDLSAISKPGRYKGEVHLSNDGASSVTAEFTVTAKRSGLYALLFIATGLVLAYILRLILTVLQPKLKKKKEVALLIQRASSFKELKSEEASLLHTYVRQLRHLLNQLDSGIPADFDTQLNLLEFKEKLFREWVQARRQVYSLRPVDLQTSLLPKLQEAQDFIASPDGDLTIGNPLLPPLRNIGNDIRKLVRDYIVGESSKLVLTAEKDLKAAGVQGSDISALKREADAIEGLPANTDADLAILKEAFTKVQDQYSSLLITDLKERLEQLKASPPPPFTSPEEWSQVLNVPGKAIEKAENANDMATRIRHFKEATRLLLVGMTDRLEAYHKAMVHKKASNPLIADAVIEEAAQVWQTGKGLVDIWSETDLDAALTASENLMDSAMRMWFPPKPAIGPEAIAPPSVTFRGPDEEETAGLTEIFFRRTGLPADTEFNLDTTDLGTDEDPESILSRLRTYILLSDLVSSLLIFMVSSVLGLLILWAPNATWGSFTDILYAVSWGFGIHTASKPPDVSGDIGKFVRKKLIE